MVTCPSFCLKGSRRMLDIFCQRVLTAQSCPVYEDDSFMEEALPRLTSIKCFEVHIPRVIFCEWSCFSPKSARNRAFFSCFGSTIYSLLQDPTVDSTSKNNAVPANSKGGAAQMSERNGGGSGGGIDGSTQTSGGGMSGFNSLPSSIHHGLSERLHGLTEKLHSLGTRSADSEGPRSRTSKLIKDRRQNNP